MYTIYYKITLFRFRQYLVDYWEVTYTSPHRMFYIGISCISNLGKWKLNICEWGRWSLEVTWAGSDIKARQAHGSCAVHNALMGACALDNIQILFLNWILIFKWYWISNVLRATKSARSNTVNSEWKTNNNCAWCIASKKFHLVGDISRQQNRWTPVRWVYATLNWNFTII